MGSTTSKETTKDVPLTPTQTKTLSRQAILSEENLQEIIRQRALLGFESTQLERDLDTDFGAEFGARASDIEDLRSVRSRVLDIGQRDLDRGGQITPEELVRLSRAEASATNAGSLRGERDLSSKLALINERLNIGSQQVGVDSSFLSERSQLNDQLLRSATAAQAAQGRVSLPLQTSEAVQGGVRGLASGQENALQAQFQMQQNAINNRLQLFGGQVSAGNALVRASVPNFEGLDRKTATKGGTSGFQLLSTKAAKHHNESIDTQEVLEALTKLDLGSIDQSKDVFGLNDMLASIQALSANLTSLEPEGSIV